MVICSADFYAGFWDLKFIIFEFFEKCIFKPGSADFYNYILYFMAGALISTLLFVCVNSCGSDIGSRIFYRFFMPNCLMEELRCKKEAECSACEAPGYEVQSSGGSLRRKWNVSLFIAAAAGGFLFLLTYRLAKNSIILHFNLAVFTVLMIAVFADIRFGIIPDSVHVMLLSLFILGNFYIYFPCFSRYGFLKTVDIICYERYLRGMLAGGGFLFLLRVLSRGGMGWGDIKLGCILGLLQGVEGVAVCFFTAFLLSAFLSIPYLLKNFLRSKKGAGKAIPFAPFLVAGAYVSQMFTGKILSFFCLYLL